MPAITLADPASMLIAMAGWISGGKTSVSTHDLYAVRALLIMFMMLFPGLIFYGANRPTTIKGQARWLS
jgi:hypothetical protein